jgi:hypothetical protein
MRWHFKFTFFFLHHRKFLRLYRLLHFSVCSALAAPFAYPDLNVVPKYVAVVNVGVEHSAVPEPFVDAPARPVLLFCVGTLFWKLPDGCNIRYVREAYHTYEHGDGNDDDDTSADDTFPNALVSMDASTAGNIAISRAIPRVHIQVCKYILLRAKLLH